MDSAERFDWDEEKAARNYRKHGVDFERASRVFEDAFAIETLDELSPDYGEDRYLIVGMTGGQLLTVVYTRREGTIRLISARKASRREHDDYYRQNSQE
jgi:uncharacterized DUF497 family protein